MIPARDREEIEACFKLKSGSVYRFLYRLTRKDAQLAEDLVQETFRKAAAQWNELSCLPDEGREAWLIKVAANTAIDSFRRRETADRVTAERIWPEVQARYRPGEIDVHNQAMTSIAIQRFTEVVDAMPPRRYQVALLHFRCGWEQHEIAEALGISSGRVSQQLKAARKTLIKELRPYMPDISGSGEEAR